MPGRTGAATVWNGPAVTRSNANEPDPITPRVALTRGGSQGLYNALKESGFAHFSSPLDTEWADGTAANFASLTFTDWNTWAKNFHGGPPGTVGVNAVLHLITDDIYINITFTSWGSGDARSYSIAAASILAKVTRDRLMLDYDRQYPGYGFAAHKGYGTPQHLAALIALGPCPQHRRSFAPLRPPKPETGELFPCD